MPEGRGVAVRYISCPGVGTARLRAALAGSVRM
jgi:hypothetical protein